MKGFGSFGLIIVLLAALLLARLMSSATNSPFYARCSDLATLVPRIAKGTVSGYVPDSIGGSSVAIPLWVRSDSVANFKVNGTPEAVARLVQKLKVEFEQAAAATGTKVIVNGETKDDDGGLMSFTLTFKTRATHGTITANARPLISDLGAAGRHKYVLDVAVKERGW